MDISVNTSAEEFELSLGTCRATLDVSQAKVLRDQLSEVLLNALYEQPGYWQNLSARLESLKGLLTRLLDLDNEQLIKNSQN